MALSTGSKAAIAWLLLLVCFLALAYRAATGGILQADVTIARAVQDLPDVAGRLFAFVNWLGSDYQLGLATVVLAAAWLLRGQRGSAALILLTFVPRSLDVLVKEAVGEPRPDAALVRVEFPHDNLSFPSGHVVGVTVVFVLAYVFAPRLTGWRPADLLMRAFCVVVVAGVGLARIWAGAHWPTDALGGYIYASLWLLPALLWLQAWRPRRRATKTARESPEAASPTH